MSRKNLKAIPSEPKKSSAAAARSSANSDSRPARERLSSSVLEELWSIWRTDSRVPSIRSRRSWATSRNVNPRLVDSWFLRRRAHAKKAGQPVPDESYDLPLVLPITPKRERSTIPIKLELEPTPDQDPPSDDTLVYPPYGDSLNDPETSSDTAFDAEDPPTDLEAAAYTEVLHQPCPKYVSFHPKSSPAKVYPVEHHRYVDSSFKYPSLVVCNQGVGKQSDFTCMLCSTKSIQDEAQSDSDPAMPDSRGIPDPPFDFFLDTLWELSAIPFLLRTPTSVLPDNAICNRNTDDWTVVEEELGRLVNEGKLDFSFLDGPDLTSMELPG